MSGFYFMIIIFFENCRRTKVALTKDLGNEPAANWLLRGAGNK